jgi:hypothetical protein
VVRQEVHFSRRLRTAQSSKPVLRPKFLKTLATAWLRDHPGSGGSLSYGYELSVMRSLTYSAVDRGAVQHNPLIATDMCAGQGPVCARQESNLRPSA